jgi:hypothetical protein
MPNFLRDLIQWVADPFRPKPDPWHESGDASASPPSGKSKPPAAPDDPEDDRYKLLGAFTTHDAERVLALLEKEGLRFQIDADTVPGGRSTTYIDRARVKIFIHDGDRERGEKIAAEYESAW